MSQGALTFEDGGTALLRDPRQVPVKVRRTVDHARMQLAGLGAEIQNEEADEEKQKVLFALAAAKNPVVVEAVADATILALVSQWSYGDVTQDVLENLPSSTYDSLSSACDKLAIQMSPNFKVDRDPKADSSAETPTSPVSVDSVNAGSPTDPSTTSPETSP